jgi:Zn-dependent protease with chaperone function
VESLDFSQDEIERARRYHGARYGSLAAGTALSAGLYALLAWPARGLFGPLSGLGWAGAAAAWAGVVVVLGELAGLPLAFWNGLVRERRWGFSAQTGRAWLADRAKGLAVSLALTAAAWTAVVGLARRLPHWWPAAAALGLALAVLVLSFVAPVVLEPLFNRFRPLDDEQLATELRGLAARAGVPVREVLVADASRRTTKVNAYVSGLGRTRRVVLYDTLLAAAGEPELKVVVAHELGHRRDRHVVKGTLLGMGGAAAAVLVLRVVLGTAGVASPRELPVVLLVLAGLELAALAPGAALSRRWERAADTAALELTGDLAAFERVQAELARTNLADLDPPRLVYLLLFSHPTPGERLALGRAWAAARQAA